MQVRSRLVVLLAVCALAMTKPAQSDTSRDAALVSLTPEQMQRIADDAAAAYDEAIALRAANDPSADERFLDSAQQFELLVHAGVASSALHYNLGNAYLQGDRVGPAIVNYRKAQRLAPGDSRIASNLEFARSRVRSRIPDSGSRAVLNTLMNVVGVVSPTWRLAGAMMLWMLAWLFLCVRIMRVMTVPKAMVATVGAIALVLGASVALPAWQMHAQQAGVVTADDVVIRLGGGDGYDPLFAEPIHEGVEFTVISRRGDWLEIELPNGARGWIRTAQATLI